MKKLVAALLAPVLALLVVARRAPAYPIDAYEETGIPRLEAFRLAQDGAMPGIVLYWGAQLYRKELKLRLADRPDFVIPPPDPEFTSKVVELLGDDAAGYGLVVLDITDPAHPRYAANHPDTLQNPGSVGKILVALAWFQALADLYPDDVDARRKLLRETQVTADAFIRTDTHIVPFWTPGEPSYDRRPIQEGDTANLYTWMDWMLSSSSNAAAAELQAQLLLLRHFGKEYPPSAEQAQAWFRETPRSTLSREFLDAMTTPVKRNGLDLSHLRQGSFFSRTGKQRVSGTSSHASAAELLHFLVRMEKGQLVDAWSSLEMKRFLYLTDKRIRYASTPSLWDWAVYFKSGSFYKCKPEKGFVCEKYMGNVFNYMNSMTMVESVDQNDKLDYMVVVLSNVLRKNSSELHRDLGTRMHALIQSLHGEGAKPETLPDVPPPPMEPDDMVDDSEVE